MKDLRSPRHLVKIRQRRGKTTGDRLARNAGEAKSASASTHSAYTESGLAIEEQVRKAWSPSGGGLAIF